MIKREFMFFFSFMLVVSLVSAFEFPSIETGFVEAINFIFGAETSLALLKFGLFLVFFAVIGHVTVKYVFPDNVPIAIIISLVLAFFSVRFFPQSYLNAVEAWWSMLIITVIVVAMLILPFTISEWISPGNKRMRWVFYVLIIGLLIYSANYAYMNNMIDTPYLEEVVRFIGENKGWVIGGAVVAFLAIRWLLAPAKEKSPTQEAREAEERRRVDDKKKQKIDLAAADKRQMKDLMHNTRNALAGWAVKKLERKNKK